MILFWLLCVSLVLGRVALRRTIGAAVEHLFRFVFPAPVRCLRPAVKRPLPLLSSGLSAVRGIGPPDSIHRAGP